MGETKKLNLYEKIQLVSNKVRNIEKDMQVGEGRYSYQAVSDIDVTLAVKDAETEFKLVSIPVKQDLINSEVLKIIKRDGKEGLTYVDTIKMTVRIIDLEKIESFIDIESFGKGVDSGDKGFGKAATYARKYALLNAYKIATGEDPDAVKSEEDEPVKTINEKQKAVIDYLNLDNDRLLKTLEHYNITTVEEFTLEQCEEMYNTLKAKKQL